jgi:hypothetical protein
MVWVLLMFGFINLIRVVTRPSVQSIRGVDMVFLIGTGMCFGAGIVGLVEYFRNRA